MNESMNKEKNMHALMDHTMNEYIKHIWGNMYIKIIAHMYIISYYIILCYIYMKKVYIYLFI